MRDTDSTWSNYAESFYGRQRRRLRIDAFKAQKLVTGNQELAEKLADIAEPMEVRAGASIINQDDYTNDIFFILVGSFSVIVNGREVATRGTSDHVGEMGAIEPTVTAVQDSLVAKIGEAAFDDLAKQHAVLYKAIAKELARRLLQRNRLVKPIHDQIRVFIICSVEALPVARLIHNGLQHDQFAVILWSEGVFKVTNYALQTLEDEIDQCDFAIAVAHGDDITEIRE